MINGSADPSDKLACARSTKSVHKPYLSLVDGQLQMHTAGQRKICCGVKDRLPMAVNKRCSTLRHRANSARGKYSPRLTSFWVDDNWLRAEPSSASSLRTCCRIDDPSVILSPIYCRAARQCLHKSLRLRRFSILASDNNRPGTCRVITKTQKYYAASLKRTQRSFFAGAYYFECRHQLLSGDGVNT